MARITGSLRDESGLAMVTALLVTMVVVTLGTVSFAMSQHSLDASARDRRGVQAIHAAEAGVDRFLRYLSTAPVNAASCDAIPDETLTSAPPASFHLVVTFYPDASGGSSALPCHTSSVPGAVLIRSTGSSAGRSRTMESWVILSAATASNPLGPGAIFSDRSTDYSGATAILQSSYDAEVYTNGDLTLSGDNGIFGNVTALGSISITGSADVKGTATAHDKVTLSGSAVVRGNARSTAADLVNSGSIYGNAYYCTGSAPGGIVGGAKVKECPSPPGPTARAFPTFTFVPSDWTSSGYTIDSPVGCPTAAFFAALSGKHLVRLTTCTDLTNPFQVNADLAIVSNGKLSMSGSNRITANPPNSSSVLSLFFNYGAATPCTSNGVTFSASSGVDASLSTLIMTPCKATFSGSSFNATGQVFAGQVAVSGSSSVTYAPIGVPGSATSGFNQAISYKREVI